MDVMSTVSDIALEVIERAIQEGKIQENVSIQITVYEQQVADLVKEKIDRAKRKHNIIIHGLSNSEDRSDLYQVLDILKILQPHPSNKEYKVMQKIRTRYE